MLILAYIFTPSKQRQKGVQPPPMMIEEEFVDDGGPLYYEADEKLEEPEAEF